MPNSSVSAMNQYLNIHQEKTENEIYSSEHWLEQRNKAALVEELNKQRELKIRKLNNPTLYEKIKAEREKEKLQKQIEYNIAVSE